MHSAQGVTADTTHAVLGENTTRAMLYVAMTRGRDTNTAYIYERTTEQEYGQLTAHTSCTAEHSDHAGRLMRAIIANHDQPVTAYDIAGQTPSAAHCPNASEASATAAQRQSNAGGQPTKSALRHQAGTAGSDP